MIYIFIDCIQNDVQYFIS